ncbi:MAG: dTMP kinase [Rickettsiales bacterium]|jgi:dTMP kinase|nr:dTMP kinase [Rickettsiales bacterium]
MNNPKGKLITIEGVDAAGKTTQIEYLKSFFKDSNNIVFTREPGGTLLSESIRDILCKGKQDNMLPITELLLFNAARYEHCSKLIKPEIAKGKIVICDRFIDSTYVYQCYAGKVPISIFEALNKLVLDDFQPDLTIILDIDTEIAASRHSNRDTDEDRFESFPKEFHQMVRAGYKKIAEENPKRVVMLDANQDQTSLHEKILSILSI